MHPAVVLLLGCATAAAQDSLAVCDLNTDLPESLGTVNLKFSESVMVHNNLGGKGGNDAHNDDDAARLTFNRVSEVKSVLEPSS